MFSFYFIFIGIPLTIKTTSSALEAMYWFSQPRRSVNCLCTLFSETPLRPISFVTNMNVASWEVNFSNSAFICCRVLSTKVAESWACCADIVVTAPPALSGRESSVLRSKKKLVLQRVTQSMSTTLPATLCLPRYFSSSRFIHCGPLRSLCSCTLWANSSSHILDVAIYTACSPAANSSASFSAYVLLPERCPPVTNIIFFIPTNLLIFTAKKGALHLERPLF